MIANLDLIRGALQSDDWQLHGIGFMKHTLLESLSAGKDRRIHLWHPDLAKIGIESNIHTHRWRLRSTILYGSITNCNVHVQEDPNGNWEKWVHGNSKIIKESSSVVGHYMIHSVDYHKYNANDTYSLERDRWHYTIANEPAITLLERSQITDCCSAALVQKGHVPIRGDLYPFQSTVKQDILDYFRRKIG